MSLPHFESYYCRSADALTFDLGEVQVWFSYRTPVAFFDGRRRYVSANIWGPTTGRHINAIDGGDKAGRLPRDVFETRLSALCRGITVTRPLGYWR